MLGIELYLNIALDVAGENPSAFLGDANFLASLNAVTFSGRFYDDTRMDTSWAFRQAYAS